MADNNAAPSISQSSPTTSTITTTASGEGGPSALSLGIMIVILGTSAGFTLYTKKTGSMLQAMNKVTENQLRNRPPKLGPPTRSEWEKMRPRIDKDEFI
jgi:hypothetical protein